MISRPSRRLVYAALALFSLTAGSVLVARSLGDFLGAASAKESSPVDSTAVKWNPTPAPPAPAAVEKGTRVSHLEVPRLRQSLYVVEGAGDEELRKGPGHVQGTAMPGEDGNCVIAAHRDTHFRFLQEIRRGDKVFLETEDGRFCYRVTGTRVIAPTDLQVLEPTPTAQLHLITCFPFYYVGHAPKRYVVTAVLD